MGSAKNLILSIITYLFIAIFAASTVYFYLKSQEKPSVSNLSSPANSKTTPNSKTPTPNSATPKTSTIAPNINTTPAPNSNRPSNPAETYTVGPGETLSGISAKLNMNWTRLTEINNLSSGDSIKEGQILIVPTYDEKTKKLFVSYKTDIEKATQIQEQTAKLPTSPYLDPAATAKSDSTNIYGLVETDTFTFVSQNELDGTAVVNVTHIDKQYIINLIQPVKKGKDGVWAISQIIPS